MMDLLYNPKTYYIGSATILTSILTKISIMPQYRYLFQTDKFKLSTYGVIVGLSYLTVFNYLNKCGIHTTKLITTIIIGILYMYFSCHSCHKTYQYIAFYKYILPIIPLIFNCTETSSIITAVAIGSAIGRLGCVSAGCCYGNVTSCDNTFITEYPDKEQIINQKNKTLKSCTRPTTMLEASFQFLLAGLCLQYPQRASAIFAIGSILLVYFTSVYRDNSRNSSTERKNPMQAYISLLFLLYICAKNGANDVCYRNHKTSIFLVIFCITLTFIYSNDININKLKIIK